MGRGEKTIGLAAAALLVCVMAIGVAWALASAPESDEQPVGRYQVAAPDLVLDTMTGKLVTAKGQMLEGPINPAGTDVGRYCVAGYVTAVTRGVGLDVLNQPMARTDVVKGYVLGDTKTGQVLKQRVYYSAPIRPGDL